MSAVARAFPSKSEDVVIDAEAPIPTKHGAFRFVVFRHADEMAEHVALVAGDVSGDDVDGLREIGVDVRRRVSIVVPAHACSRSYLATKRARMGHALPHLFKDQT